jgi:Outer membrane lipoprotein carrier protein LolA-like
MTRRSLPWCAILFSFLLVGAAPVAKIHDLLAKPKVLCGRFDQSKQLVGLKKPVKSSGRFCVVADKGVLWRSLQPFPNTVRLTRDEIVQLQGERVAFRLNAKEEPTVRVINQVLFSLLAGNLGELEKLFEIDGSIYQNSWNVTLNAREPAVAKAIGKIALEGGEYVKNITIDHASGDRTSIVFSALQSGTDAMTADEAALF